MSTFQVVSALKQEPLNNKPNSSLSNLTLSFSSLLYHLTTVEECLTVHKFCSILCLMTVYSNNWPLARTLRFHSEPSMTR